jgi:glycosyltransferase involved in cell wall biosynthesis
MRIAQLAPVVESVPPTGYGGIELVVSLLTEELVRRGHQVTLFASGDSQTSARLVSVIDGALRKTGEIKHHSWPAYDMQNLFLLQDMQHEFDVVHNHIGWQALPYLNALQIPSLTTNHNLIEHSALPIYRRHKQHAYVAISAAYKTKNHGDELNYVDVIHNGIDLTQYPIVPTAQRKYLAFLGRLCLDKGIVQAIEMAQRLQMPLRIAGKVDPADRDYFDSEVKPLLDLPFVTYIGEVDHAQKVELLKGAIATLYPITFDEPFGLVMAESLACSTPVVALDRGSVREVLTDRETAIVDGSVDRLVERFPELEHIDRRRCRLRAESLFAAPVMTERYESLYQRLIREAVMSRGSAKTLIGTV